MASKRRYFQDYEDYEESSSDNSLSNESDEESDSSNKENSNLQLSNNPKSVKKFKKDEAEYPEEIEIIKEALSNAPPSGEYSIGGEASELPTILGMKIKNFGDVSLPLSEFQAEELIKKCTQAPYGHNFDTLIDTKVRDSFQIEPSSIEIKNPEWTEKLQQLVDKVCSNLGCKGKAEAKLYKLLLYKTGGHFTKHRDTEKDKNMFATMVLQLPSIHTGGDLIVYNPDKTKTTHDFGKAANKAAFKIHYAAHYADAEHELTKITSGYRIALVYSICWINGNGICTFNSKDHGLRQALDILKNKDQIIGIMLEHRYTPKSLQQNGIRVLKGVDNDRLNMLRCANQKLNEEDRFDFNLVHACLTVESYDVGDNWDDSYNYGYECDYNNSDYKWEENERCTEIKQWYDSEGKQKLNLNRVSFSSRIFDYVIDINRAHVLQDDDFKNEKSFGKKEMQEEIDYTGNEGINKTTVYNRYLMILMPKKYQFELYCRANLSFAIEYLGNAYDSMSRETLSEKLKKCVMQLSRDKMILDSSLVTILKLLTTANDIHLVKLFLNKLPRISDALLKGILTLILTFEWNELVVPLGSLLNHRDNTLITCKLVKQLIEFQKDELAFKCCEKFLYPIFDDENYFKKLNNHSDMILNHFFTILDTILLFERPDLEDQLKKLVHLLSEANLSQEKLANFVQRIDSKFDCYRNSPSVISIVKMRINWLEGQIKPNLEFNWRMNGSIAGHPRFEQFLKSDESTMAYNGVLSGVVQARKFISVYSGLKNGYSVSMNYSGTGSKVVVHITKTPDYYNSKLKILNNMKSEINNLKERFGPFLI